MQTPKDSKYFKTPVLDTPNPSDRRRGTQIRWGVRETDEQVDGGAAFLLTSGPFPNHGTDFPSRELSGSEG